jgi:hypothetical protein
LGPLGVVWVAVVAAGVGAPAVIVVGDVVDVLVGAPQPARP